VGETWLVAELLVIALFSGSVACWLLKVDDTLPVVLGAGAVGVYLEPWISLRIGPSLFDYSLLSCLAGAVAAAFFLGIVQSFIQSVTNHQHRVGRRNQLLSAR